MPIEHALYASANTGRHEGYHVVSASPGICVSDLQDLSAWCPTHDGLLRDARQSVSCFPLPSGARCVARSRVAAGDYSARGGAHVVTDCLVLDRETFARFANNPFAIITACTAAGHFDHSAPWPERLASFELIGGARPVDRMLLRDVQRRVGTEAICRALDVCCRAERTGILAGLATPEWIAAVWNCLPIAMRADLSFATAHRFSSQWSFDWLGLAADPSEARRLAQQSRFEIVHAASENDESATTAADQQRADSLTHGWARFVAECLDAERFDALEKQVLGLSSMSREALHETGDALCEAAIRDATDEFSVSVFRIAQAHAPHEQHQRQPPDVNAATESANGASNEPRLASTPRRPTGPSDVLPADSPEVVQQLERLDDTIFAAITGKADALTQVESLWHEVVESLGRELVEESREQYLRYAITVWEKSQSAGQLRKPEYATAALEVITLLIDE